MDLIKDWDHSILYTAVPATLTAIVAYRILTARWDGHWKGGQVLPSPWKTVVAPLSAAEQKQLPYPPDIMPGARDVETPYGSIRVYEWGNEDGPKVLLIHGISTPCISLAAIAERLVAQGKRVMLFDLFGRGYSDTPEPASHPQNIQLFTTQIMLALSSSPLSWLGGDSSFRLVGYSLGGGIAASFTSHFPKLVESLVLIAPAGIMRPERIAFTSRLTYAGVLPESLVHYLVRRRMSGGRLPVGKNGEAAKAKEAAAAAAAAGAGAGASGANGTATSVAGAVAAEVPGGDEDPAYTPDSEANITIGEGQVSIAKAVQWQLKHHHGFLPAFISSIQHAPITEQQPRWRIIGQRLERQRAAAPAKGAKQILSGEGEGLRGGKVLMILGNEDGVIIGSEVEADGRACLGSEGLEVKYVDAGHDLPVVKADEVAATIVKFWAD